MILRRLILYLVFLCVLLPNLALAQEISGNLQEIRVVGASTNIDLIKVNLLSREGTPASQIDLEAERNRIYALGTFSEVTVKLEDRGNGAVLVVEVTENPRVAEVIVNDSTLYQGEQLANLISRTNLVEAGRIYSTTRAEEAIQTIQRAYRDGSSTLNVPPIPFDIPVDLEVTTLQEDEYDPAQFDGKAPVRLTYTVTEDVPITQINYEQSEVFEEEDFVEAFKTMRARKAFVLQLYRDIIADINQQYYDLGYRGSGIDLARTELVDSVLNVKLRELRIVSIDTTAIGVDPSELSLEAGDLYNYDVLLEDVRRLATGRTNNIRLEPLVTSSGAVRVVFASGPPASAGPIDTIQIEGNTVFSTEELMSLLTLSEGDTFTSTLANEDFQNIRQRYDDAGYLISSQPDYNYLDGTYVQRITEIKIAGYNVIFEGDSHRTEDFVITRYLPEVGSVYNINQLRTGLITVARLGGIEPLSAPPVATDNPDEAMVNINVRERQTRTFTPAAEYDTITGFSATLSYGDSNFLGRAHNFNAEATATTSDIGFLAGASINYSIPWLYIDFLDFQEVPTSLSFSVFSRVDINQSLVTDDGSLKVCYDETTGNITDDGTCDDSEEYFVGDYAQRNTGFAVSFGRQIFPDTTARLSARTTYSQYYLEPADETCDPEEDSDCALPKDVVTQADYLPDSGLTGIVQGAVTYDTRDSVEFPREGLYTYGSLGLGYGNDYRDANDERIPYTYVPLEFGVRTYVTLQELFPGGGVSDDHVLAFRVSGGHQFGGDYPSSRYFSVGNTIDEDKQIRGYRTGDFNDTRTYLTGSVEYRYDFGLDTFATQTIIGIVFADIGYLNEPFDDAEFPVFGSAGVGVQLNLGFGGFALPPLRFDYGFSEINPRGVFSFRLGAVF